jgi:hypothetical protein
MNIGGGCRNPEPVGVTQWCPEFLLSKIVPAIAYGCIYREYTAILLLKLLTGQWAPHLRSRGRRLPGSPSGVG